MEMKQLDYIPFIALVALLVFGSDSQASIQLTRSETWTKSKLSYSVFGNVAAQKQTSEAAVMQALHGAFGEWEKMSCFEFKDVTPDSRADIKLIFTNDDAPTKSQASPFLADFSHKNFCKFNIQGIAAHAFFRSDRTFPAQIHINNELFWMESTNPAGRISLQTILAHEIGHVLGLVHSHSPKSIMYKYIFTGEVKHVTRHDQYNLKRLYRVMCLREGFNNWPIRTQQIQKNS